MRQEKPASERYHHPISSNRVLQGCGFRASWSAGHRVRDYRLVRHNFVSALTNSAIQSDLQTSCSSRRLRNPDRQQQGMCWCGCFAYRTGVPPFPVPSFPVPVSREMPSVTIMSVQEFQHQSSQQHACRKYPSPRLMTHVIGKMTISLCRFTLRIE